MANSPRRIYWDACNWIALIQMEKIPLGEGKIEDRGMLCRTVVEAARKGAIEIVTSTLCLVEVSKDSAMVGSVDKLADYFENDYIALANLDRFAAERARELMRSGFSKLKPPDAIHLATAAISNVEEMHTFDARLLALDGLIDKADGSKLKICKPDAGDNPAPLLAAMHGQGPAALPPADG